MYKSSAELKREARAALSGKWKDSILLNLIPILLQMIAGFLVMVGMIALFLFAFSTVSSQSNMNEFNRSNIVDDFGEYDDDEYDFDESFGMDSIRNNRGINTNVTITSTIWGVVLSFLTIGISFTFLDVLRDPTKKINPMADAFRVFNGKDFIPVLLIEILSTFFVKMWTLLFIIPGIIKEYSYSQAKFIYKDLSEYTDTTGMSATSYITESKLLMNGHKGRLFYIDLSFIGWDILCGLTFGLASIYVTPLKNATKAAFYNDLAKDRYTPKATIISEEDEWTNF